MDCSVYQTMTRCILTDLSHVEVTAANASTNVQHMFTRLQFQQLHELLTPHTQFFLLHLYSTSPMTVIQQKVLIRN